MTRFATLLACFGMLAARFVPATEPVDFVRDVMPVLERYCVGCHQPGDTEGGLDLSTHRALLGGGDSGIPVTAGAADSSRLFLMASGRLEPVMPPEGEPRPNEDELRILAAWIDQGAAGPEGEMPVKRELRVPSFKKSDDVSLPITAVAQATPSDRRAVARFGTVEILDGEGKVRLTLPEQPGKVNSLQFSRDGSRLLVASGLTGAYGQASVYDAESGTRLLECVGHRDTLYSAVFSPDETLIATAGYDRDILLWDAATGEPLRTLSGHNGAIFDLAFSPDGEVLVSGCADETVKVWHVATGERLDTLSQPEGEVFAVAVTPDGRFVLAGSADNRLRVWRLLSKAKPRINPIVATRFVDESPLVAFAISPQSNALVVLSEAGNVKVIDTETWNQRAVLEPLGETATDLVISGDGKRGLISLMDGRLVTRDLPESRPAAISVADPLTPVYLALESATMLEEPALKQTARDSAVAIPAADLLSLPRGAVVTGEIEAPGQTDHYTWQAGRGEVWAIDVDAIAGSRLDPFVSITNDQGQPVLRTRLQAVRDSYFTFRGKNSEQANDFRMFAWEEMQLDDYLYAAGEVTRLWMHPRGPDSGFNVYPGDGVRWTYFGTNPATHALGEPAYVVRPLAVDAEPLANGLPVFDVYYENDDDPQRLAGKNSRLIFTAPGDGRYVIRVSDSRGDGGESFGYRMTLRAASPDFRPSVQAVSKPIPLGSGREFVVRIDRLDGFDGEVRFDLEGLPPGVIANTPLVIEEGQREAIGTLWADPSAEAWEETVEPRLIATADILGRRVERSVGSVGKLSIGPPAAAIPRIVPIDGDGSVSHEWTLQVRRGETVSARVVLERRESFTQEVSFGKEFSGRNATHGVYVDNIGLNGLLVRQDETDREFFLTADPVATPGKRSFFLTAGIDGGVTTQPIIVEVLP